MTGNTRRVVFARLGVEAPRRPGAALRAVWLHADDPTPADGEVVPLRSSIETSGPYSELRAFVAGATGGTGQAIVRRLIAEGVPVRALVRNVSQAVSCYVEVLSVVPIS